MTVRRGLLALLSVLAAVCACASPAVGQGSAADYTRASQLRERTAGAVRGGNSAHRWIDAHRLWFAEDRKDGGRAYVLVDARIPERRPLFDHDDLAAKLSDRLGREVDSMRLPIDRLEVVEDGVLLLVRGLGIPLLYRHDSSGGDRAGATARLDDAPAPLQSRFASDLRPNPARSRNGGPGTSLRFVNATAKPLHLLWVDARGAEHSYGTIAAGASRDQPTYSGHAWVVRDEGSQPLGWVVADDEPRVVVVPADAVSVDDAAEAAAPQRRRRSVTPNSAAVPGIAEPGPLQAERAAEPAQSEPTVEFHGSNVLVRDPDGTVILRTDDGTEDNPYVAPPHWSPDRSSLLVMRRTSPEPHPVTVVESAPSDQVQPKVHTFNYQKPGDGIARSSPQLLDVRSRRAVPLSGALPEHPWSISRVHWSPDSSRVFLLNNERGHRIVQVLSIDVATGVSTAIVDERPATFFDYAGKLWLEHLDETDELLWMSERDGWNHLYLIDRRSGVVKRQLTQGAWVVLGVESVDRVARSLVARAGGIHPGQDPYHAHWIRVPLDGGEPTILTSGDGTHRIAFSPGGDYLVDTWSRVDLPPVTELRRASDGASIMELGRVDWTDLLATGWRVPERFAAKGRDGQTDIWGVIWTPTTFDPAVRYPVIENIYAGPHASFVPKAFQSFYAQQELAELGFVVVQIDGMGTSNRSKAFHDVCWKNLKDAGLPDRVAWLRAAAATRPWMDLDRVGIYGGSAGGQNAVRALLDHPDVYKVGVADCGCHDNRMDKIWWNELWMSWPVDESYAASSNVTDAGKLQGKLLLVVGELDRNVDPASTMQVVNALIKADKDFDLLVIPGAGHGAAESPYGRRRRADFFVRHLLGVEPRWSAAASTGHPTS